jgi:hypothetical protein
VAESLPPFRCPLTHEDWQAMREICQRCDQRKPYIDALDQLGIETGAMHNQNDAQQQFCTLCERLRNEGKL